MEFKSKDQIKNAIKNRITTDKNAAIKAMLRIYEYQTESEQASGTTHALNGVGFAGVDAEILTSFSQQYLAKGYLSDRQMALLYKKIGKYAGQLLTHAINKGLYVKNGGVWSVAKAS